MFRTVRGAIAGLCLCATVALAVDARLDITSDAPVSRQDGSLLEPGDISAYQVYDAQGEFVGAMESSNGSVRIEVEPGQEYCFSVSVVDSGGNEGDRSPLSCAVAPYVVNAPGAPARIIIEIRYP